MDTFTIVCGAIYAFEVLTLDVILIFEKPASKKMLKRNKGHARMLPGEKTKSTSYRLIQCDLKYVLQKSTP